MKVTIAVDSFKGSLSSMEAGRAIGEGVRRAYPEAEIHVCPMADGGEGTVEALTEGMGGTIRSIRVTGPTGQPIQASYGIISTSGTAVLEMAAAAGLPLVPKGERDPRRTTTYGVGEMIRDAIHRGCRKFIIGIGGSATNDAGIGMLQALGASITDAKGRPVPYGAEGLREAAHIDMGGMLKELQECTFRIACDVNNPLCGPRGCAAVYGPQKGATPEMVRDMDRWMEQYADLVKSVFPGADPSLPGAGAAGGIGFGFSVFLKARLEPGVQIVLDETQVAKHIQDSDFVITGEGRLDAQTLQGKAPAGVALLARKFSVPVIAMAGSVTKDAVQCNQKGIDAFFPILPGPATLDEAMDPAQAMSNLEQTAEQVFRLVKTTIGRFSKSPIHV